MDNKAKIINIIKKIRTSYDDKIYNNLYQELKFDSFDMLNIINMLQKEFQIKIDTMNIDETDFMSIQSIEQLIERSKKI